MTKQKPALINVTTLSGALQIPSLYGWDPATKRWMNPLRIRLGLDEDKACSPELVERLCFMAPLTLSYEACEQIARCWGAPVSDATIQHHVCEQGARIGARRDEEVEEALEPATRQGVVERAGAALGGRDFSLVIMLDGWMIRERGGQWGLKPPEAAGERVEWREMKTGIVFRLEDLAATQSGRGVILKKHYEAWRGEAHDFGRRLYALALRQGLMQAARVFVVADGGVWIWNLAQERFPGAREVLDFYHASQHLHAVARALHADEEQARQWVAPLLHQLKHGGQDRVIENLEQLTDLIQTLAPEPAKTVTNTLAYFQEHRRRLNYQQAAEQGCPIGSGAIESTCSQLQDRFKRTGQFWTQPGAAQLMTLDIIRRNEEWDDYWERMVA